MTQSDGSSSPGSRGPTRRSVLGSVGAVSTALVAGCSGVLGSSDGDKTAAPGETPNTEFEVEQNLGILHREHQIITIEITHAGGHALRTANLELYHDDTPIPEPKWWGWTTVMGDPTGWEHVGDLWKEEEYISVTSDSPEDHGVTVDLSGLFELVWTSPETGEEETLLTYEPYKCDGNLTPTEEGRCPEQTTEASQ